VSGENEFTDAISFSEWADVLTFGREHGQAEPGPNAIAELMVSINGLLFVEDIFWPLGTGGRGCQVGSQCIGISVQPTLERHAYAEVGTIFGVDVPQYVRIETESGTQYPTSVPEPATVIMLFVGLVSLTMIRRNRLCN
jgi:hypothetical protein